MQRRREKLSGVWEEQMVVYGQSRRPGFAPKETLRPRSVRIRVRAVWAVCIAILAVVVSRVVYLQVFESGQRFLMSETNHIDLIREPAPRGTIYDNNGIVLAGNVATTSAGPSGTVITNYLRRYPMGTLAAPIVGYLSEVTTSELGCLAGTCFEPGMTIGRMGVEKTMEGVLRGTDGGRLVEVDAQGRLVRELGSNPPQPGEDVTLSVDSRLQQIMYTALGGRSGSAVAVDMQGKVLGLVSSPTYDPSHLSDYLSDTTQHFFLNRAITGEYPAGSVFKLVTSYAGLMSGAITPDTLFTDTGFIQVGPYRYGNWYFDEYGKVEGQLGVVQAIAHSNDVFFYQVGAATGVNTLDTWARNFGFGSVTGIELPSEAAGLVPTELWKLRNTGNPWFLGDTYHLAIGQGDLLVTPVQIARMTAAAVSGQLCQLSLLKNSPIACRDLGLDSTYMELVREGMQGACTTGGTAFPFFHFEPWVLCKTGTAQTGGPSDSDKADAWLTVAYPGDNPKMVLTVMLESAGEGSYEAGPVAASILSQWRDLGN